MDLQSDTYKPFLKPNNRLLYVNSQSNHPPLILKNIPKSVNKRLTELSSSEEIFNQNVKPYQEALQRSGYQDKLKFIKVAENASSPKKSRKEI